MIALKSMFHPGEIDCGPFLERAAEQFFQRASERVSFFAAQAGTEAEVLAKLSSSDVTGKGSACWTPELGAAMALARQGGAVVQNAVAQLALCYAALGFAQDMEIPLAPVTAISFSGVPLPRSESIRILSGSGEVVLGIGEDTYCFRRTGTIWTLEDRPYVLRSGIRSTDVIATGGNCLDAAISPADDIAIGSDAFPAAVESLAEAFALVRDTAPEYTEWTRQLIRQVHVLGQWVGKLSKRTGRSSVNRPGLIMATSPWPNVLLAEQLVHESSHQHFYMMQLLSRTIRSGHMDREFISPLNGKRRDVGRYLLAYHVVANMVMFHTRVVETNHPQQELARERLVQLRPMAIEYMDTLTANEDLLTEEGNSFWVPSRDTVRELCASVH